MDNTNTSPRSRASSTVLKRVGLASIVLLLATVVMMSLLRPSATFPSPLLLAVLNLIFQSIALFAVAWVASSSYLRRNLPQLLVISTSMIVFGTVVLINSLNTIFSLDASVNFLVTGHNLALLLFAILNLTAVILVFFNAPLSGRARPPITNVVLAAAASVVISIALISIAAVGALPPFWASGSTFIRNIVLIATIGSLIMGMVFLALLHRETRSAVLYWYALGLSMYAVGVYSILADPWFDGLLIWSGRIAQYLGSVFLILSILASQRGERWTNAFSRSRVQFDNLFASMGEAFVYLSLERDPAGAPVDFRYMRTNGTFKRIAHLGNDVEGKLGSMVGGVVPDFMEVIKEVDHGGVLNRQEIYHPNSGRWFSMSAYSVEKDHYAVIFSDITDAKRAESALRESEARYRLIYENSLDAVLLTRPDGTILTANPAAQKMFGMTEEQIINAGRSDLVVMDSRFEEAIKERATKGKGTAELSFRRRDGSIFTGETTSSLFTDADGTIQTSMIIRDVTETRRARQKAEELTAFLTEVIDNSPEGIAVFDGRDLRVKAMNAFYQRNFIDEVFKDADLIGKRIDEFIPPIRSTPVYSLLKEVAETGSPFVANEFEFDGFERGTTYWNLAYVPIGPVDHRDVLVTAVEVTSLVEARKRMEEERARLQAVLEAAPIGVFIADASGKMLMINEGVKQIWGMDAPLSESIERYADYVGWHHETGKRYEAEDWALARALKNGEVVVGEVIEIQRFDGRHATIINSASPVRDDRGNITGAVVTAQDITELNRARRWAEGERSRLQAVLDAAPIGIFIGNSAGGGVLLNEAFYKIWGANAPTPETRIDYQRYRAWSVETGVEITGDDWPGTRALDGESVSIVADIQKFDGGHATAIISAVPLRQDGQITGNVMVFQDISEMRKTEADLRRANAELQQFAYVASHDLQEPLRMVSIYLGLLDKKYRHQLDEKAQEYIDYAVSGSVRMRALIDDLLAYTRLDSQTAEPTNVDLNQVMADVQETLRTAKEESGAEITVRPLPTVMGRGSQLTQVMQNLVANAIKFRGKEPPRIEIWSSSFGRDWRIAVKDNGIGIASDYRDRIFMMFQRLHTKDEYPGAGIGLAIAKKIVERHGGRIWFESEPGKGTTFFFTIPKEGAA